MNLYYLLLLEFLLLNIKYFSLANPFFISSIYPQVHFCLFSNLFAERHNQKISYLYVFNIFNERVDNNDFKVVAQNGISVSVILDFNKLSCGDLYYFMDVVRDDGLITKRVLCIAL